MRITVLAIPPVINLIRPTLHLNETAVGVLTGLPTLLFSAAAIGGALLISRVGVRRAVITGFVVVAIAGALRGVGPSIWWLFPMTLLMGVGIALVQPAFPPLVRLWSPDRISLATSVYSTGLLVGEALPPILTAAVLLPLAGGWETALAIWSAPVLLGAVLIAALTPHEEPPAADVPARWWPDWRGLTWSLGLLLGGDSALYWSCNTFIPRYLEHSGRDGLVTPALIALNLGQVPAALVIAALPDSLLRRRSAYVVPGLLSLLGVVALVAAPGPVPVLAAVWLGFLSAWVFVLALALPAAMVDPPDIPRLAAGMFTISYVCSFTAPVIGGTAWDRSGVPALAFLPALAACCLVAVMAARLRVPERAALLPVAPA